MVWLRAVRLPLLADVWHVGGLSRGQSTRTAPNLFAAFDTKSPEWVLLETMDVTTTSLEKAGLCQGLPWQLVVTGSPELLWGLASAAPEHPFQEG